VLEEDLKECRVLGKVLPSEDCHVIFWREVGGLTFLFKKAVGKIVGFTGD
jgi:hypothetical protein